MQLYASMSVVLLTIGAVLVYSFLRFAAHAPTGRDEARWAARRHGFWTALIGFFAVGILSGRSYGVVDSPIGERQPGTVPMGWNADWPGELWSLLLPMAGLGAIYVIAQYTWPRPKGSVRSAELSVRRIIDFIPRNLTLLAILLTLVTGALVVAAAGLEEVAPRESEFGYGLSGRASGGYFATGTGLALLILITGTAMAIVVIVRRRPVPGLSMVDDATVRRIGLNRLLRTVILTLVTLLSAVVSYGTTGTADALNPPVTFWTTISGPLPLVILAVFIAMLFWAPPQLGVPREGEELAPPRSRTYQRALRVSNRSRLIGYILLALVWPFMFFAPVSGITMAPAGLPAMASIIAVAYAGFLLVIAAGEFVLRGESPSSRTAPLPFAAIVPRVFAAIVMTVILLVIVAGAVVFNLAPNRDTLPHLMGAAAAIVLSGTVAVVVTWRRSAPSSADGTLDSLLRKVSVHRVLRLTASAMLLLLAVLIHAHSLLLSMQLGIYQAPSQGMAPELQVPQTILLAAAIGMAMIPGPARPRASRIRETVEVRS
ncbi:hypothetical protein [Arthrobacter roseus]|uniref:hypothetical protein n=1 Tax=Arthrobacter roseus TaxID=136274 RepID=UPI0019650E16|nr:hypothetical protein [Arthrobacter roseus]MBM7849365.1 hypothetical protein [Arthrobacter roseus]